MSIAARAHTWKVVDPVGTVHLGNQQAPEWADGVTWLGPEAREKRLPQQLPPPQKLPGYYAVRDILRAAAAMVALDLALLAAVAATESAFNPMAVSRKGAIGLMQIMPSTAIRYGVVASTAQGLRERLFDPVLNAQLGARVLSDLVRRFGDRLELAVAAYNAGEGAVERYGRRIPPYTETEQYVLKVLSLYIRWHGLA